MPQMIDSRDAGRPTCPFDHQATSVVGDQLYEIYAEARPHGPTWSPHHGGFWMVTSYDGVRSALRDHETFSSAGGCMLPDNGYRNLALEQDPPENAPFRNIFLSAVGRNAVLAHEQQLREMVQTVVAEFVAAGGGDARAQISEKVPVEGICLMLGLSPRSAARVRKLATDAWEVMLTDPAALEPMMTMLMGEVSDRREHPRDDFLTHVTTTEVQGRELTDDQIANILSGAVFAGHETTMNASSNLMAELARDPELQTRLRQHPDEIPQAIEECLRHRAPIHMFFRTVTAETELSGVSMHPGEKVALIFAGANRDPERFPDPDAFLPDREDVAHVSFGWGVHRCVGSFLAQTELRLIAQALLDAGDLTLREVEMTSLTGGLHMGMKRVEIGVTPR
jgi:cytochrome P450